MAYTIAALDARLPSREMTDLVTDIVASSLKSLGLCTDGFHTIADLSLDRPPAHCYERWLSRTLDYLQERAVLGGDRTFRREVGALPQLWNAWEAKHSAWAADSHQQAQCALLETCLRALPGVLSGRQRATGVMFPNSSLQLVEGIQRSDPQAIYFNQALGEILTGCIEQQLAADRSCAIRILEVGAGTGATTATLLPLLQRYPIAEYCYTDVSNAFLLHGEQQFQPQCPTLTTAVFDVCQPLESQSVAANHYDFVIAANVLHATLSIRDTLRNAKAALKNQGVLLLNEISAWSLFNHLTFGLLEEWWLYEDAALRLPGCPGLSPEMWREVLTEEGFEAILFPVEEAHRFGQQIVAAVSNGWTRQRIARTVPAQASAGDERAPDRVVAAAARPVVQARAGTPAPTAPAAADHTRRIIIAALSDALRMDAAAIGDDGSFADYGVDSIIGVNLVRTICEALQIELETTSLFDYSTVEQLTGHILQHWQGHIAARLAESQPAPQAPAHTIDEASPPVEARSTPSSMPGTRFADARFAFGADTTGDSERPVADPIAIIGMSGRFAESESLDAFWQHLAQGEDLVKPVSRWRAADCVISESPSRAYCSRGSFVDSIDRFDPAFFGISAVEAAYMDPQQRLFLEESWNALENAGYAGKAVHETTCGVYVGCGGSHYDTLSMGEAPPHAFWGNSQAVTPARIAYCLNLQGPAIAVDTACSSSLVAIHLACQGLWSRETAMALAGGVFLQPTPGFYQVANRAGMLSPTGACRSFDARANGFVPGEGVGVIVLKRLRDAIADGDFVHGVIAASGINQDGRSNGLTAPNGRAQERLERSVYDRFKINPETIQVVEAHGTGTLLGDSIECGALSRAFREYTDRKQFCALGTVKTNIGHASTAAGVAGVLKLLLALKHRQIPPSLHFDKGNPAIDFESGPFYVNTRLQDWPAGADGRRRAAVSSFGFSGTNAHLIIEEAPASGRTAAELPIYLAVLSARTAEQLQQHARNLLAYLRHAPGVCMTDLSFSLFVGRTHFAHRLACLAGNQHELIHRLEQWTDTGSASQVYTAETQETKIREQVLLKKFGNHCIEQCKDAVNDAGSQRYHENLAAIAELYVQGHALDFPALFDGSAGRTALPTYPFARERYWVGDDDGVWQSDGEEAPAATQRSSDTAASNRQQGHRASEIGAVEDLRPALLNDLSGMVAEFVHCDPRDLPIERVLVDLGLDSIGLANLAKAINQKFQVDLTPVVFFDYPSVGELAKHLAAEHGSEIRAFYRASANPAQADDGCRTAHRPDDDQPAGGADRTPTARLTPRESTPRHRAAAPRPSGRGTAHERRVADEPVAIVGIAAVMPQSADVDAFWAHLRDSQDLVTVIPEDRWNWQDYYGDPLKEPNTSNSKWGGFMKEIDKFDPLFFGISPREAQMMDPQQRIFLETVWKAIEDSGQKVADLSGTRTGLFVGVGSYDYVDVLRNQADVLDGYTASGNSHSVLANRVSFLLNLRGPSAPIDTACSSSLVALHRAVESMHAGGCDMAIVGGVQVILSPGAYISFGMAGMLSSDGKCKAFDKRANGYVRGEGCGAIFLKRLSMAEADGNHIYGVIKATAENHGGRVTTLTAPNSAAQAALLIEAYDKAQIDPATVGYIECHGTGTSLGDPIEIQALSKAFSELYKRHNRAPAGPPHCGLGTVKSNIGHLETAAGIAGVLKVLLAVKHGQIPATIHFKELNQYINLKGTPFYIVDRLTPWAAAAAADGSLIPRRAGVSSFGFGGANAHAVLEEYVPASRQARPAEAGPHVVVLSAQNRDRLDAYVQSMRACLEPGGIELCDFAYTLQVGRDAMPERLAFVASSAAEAKRTFDEILNGGELPPGCYQDNVTRREKRSRIPEGADEEAVVRTLIERSDLTKLAELWVSGAPIDWQLLHQPGVPRRISIPTYPFARERHWVSGAAAGIVRQPARASARGGRRQGAADHEGTRSVVQSLVPVWNAVTVETSKQSTVPHATRILLLGSDPARFEWLRRSYPHAERIELPVPSSVEAIAQAVGERAFDHLLWIAPDVNTTGAPNASAAALLHQQEEGVLAVFRIAKALLQRGYGSRALHWTLVTSRTQTVADGESIQPTHAGVIGLIGSLAKEYPGWNLRLLDVESLVSLGADDCLSLPWDPQGNVLAHRRGEWFQQGMAAAAMAPSATPACRHDGVYVVIGGAGGIGEVWSRFMIQHYQAKIAWIGRRQRDPVIDEKIASLARLGQAPLYVSADATSVSALADARRTILQTYPTIHGVVHSALVLRDQGLARMDEATFREGLSAKVDITINLDAVFGSQALDFMLFFSSVVSFLKPAGQANYSAGCTFKDSYARMLRQRGYPVKVLNWGYWGGVGVAADDAHRQRMARLGLGSIEPEEGMAALEVVMQSEASQVAVVKTFERMTASTVRPGAREPTDVTRIATVNDRGAATAGTSPSDAPGRTMIANEVRHIITETLADELRMDASMIHGDRPLTDYGVESIVGVNVVRRINETLRIELDPASLFEYRTVNELTTYILGNWRPHVDDVGESPAGDGESSGQQLGSTPPSSSESTSAIGAELASDEELLHEIVWQETSRDDRYEKLTF